MSRWVPFTVYFKINPVRGKRFEYVRSMQRIAIDIFDAINTLSNTVVSVAHPGGGQAFAKSSSFGALSNHSNGMAVKPQFGNNPSQVMLTGFYNADNDNLQPYAEHTLIAGNEQYDGARAHSQITGPLTFIDTEVSTLRTLLEGAIDSELPSLDYQIFRMDYSNIVYGYGGYHFPS